MLGVFPLAAEAAAASKARSEDGADPRMAQILG